MKRRMLTAVHHVQEQCDTWLSTKDRKKVKHTAPPKPKSALRPRGFSSSMYQLQLTQTKMPVTATKQTTISSFFHKTQANRIQGTQDAKDHRGSSSTHREGSHDPFSSHLESPARVHSDDSEDIHQFDDYFDTPLVNSLQTSQRGSKEYSSEGGSNEQDSADAWVLKHGWNDRDAADCDSRVDGGKELAATVAGTLGMGVSSQGSCLGKYRPDSEEQTQCRVTDPFNVSHQAIEACHGRNTNFKAQTGSHQGVPSLYHGHEESDVACLESRSVNSRSTAHLCADSRQWQSGTMPAKSGTTPVKSGTGSVKPGTTPVKSGTRSVKSAGTTPVKSGTRLVKSGITAPKSGTRPVKSAGTTPVKSGRRPIKSGSMPNQTKPFLSRAEGSITDLQEKTAAKDFFACITEKENVGVDYHERLQLQSGLQSEGGSTSSSDRKSTSVDSDVDLFPELLGSQSSTLSGSLTSGTTLCGSLTFLHSESQSQQSVEDWSQNLCTVTDSELEQFTFHTQKRKRGPPLLELHQQIGYISSIEPPPRKSAMINRVEQTASEHLNLSSDLSQDDWSQIAGPLQRDSKDKLFQRKDQNSFVKGNSLRLNIVEVDGQWTESSSDSFTFSSPFD